MNLVAKTVFFSAVYLMTAKAAFAQITVDLDVLTEDFIPKDAITLKPTEHKKENTPPTLKAPAIQPKKTPAAKAVPPKKPAVKKPAVKKTTAPKKPQKPLVKKEEKKSVKKYQIKESAQKDEHDKLKPRANPVPKVKILASDNTVKPAEKTQSDTIEISSEESIEPKISKHFLEQERLKKQKDEQNTEIKINDNVIAEDEPSKSSNDTVSEKDSFLTLQQENSLKRMKPKMLLSEAEQKSSQPIKKKTNPIKFSVFYIPGKLTPSERSAVLEKEIPADSATKKALSQKQKKELLHIFVFEKKSSALTDEMQTALDGIADMMKKNRDKKLLLYSYSSVDPADPGKERQYSLRRALMIRSYLAQKGIHSLRVEIHPSGQKGAGEKMPDRTDILIQDK